MPNEHDIKKDSIKAIEKKHQEKQEQHDKKREKIDFLEQLQKKEVKKLMHKNCEIVYNKAKKA